MKGGEKNNALYQKALDILTSQGKFHISLGLERISQVLELLGNPQKEMKFIHVAGTNGKGSVCAMLNYILKNGFGVKSNDSPIKVGLYTSPHIFDYTERIKIQGVDIAQDDFARCVEKIVSLADDNNIHLTEFEILTALAFDYFLQNDVDIVILETGLGGRLDATNVIENNICSIITHLDFDHTERLGDTIEKIAFEKAGIIKNNCPVVVAENNAGFKIIEKVAKEKNSTLHLSKKPHKDYELGLLGKWQKENLSLVLEALDILRETGYEISDEALDKGLREAKHPCRFEYIKEHNLIIDGAHNPDGTKALRESLDEYFPDKKFQFIFGCLNNKDYLQMMKNLFRTGDEIYFNEFSNPNSCTYEQLSSSCELESKPFKLYTKDDSKLTVICGSFYMIKELLAKMGLK